MAMRLLPKQEVSSLQAAKKRVEIDEGIKLARRVDSLREIAASEEASLALFRTNTLKSISEDIKKIETERETVAAQVNELRKELAEGTKQLDIRAAELDTATNLLEGHKMAFKERLDRIRVVVTLLKELSAIGNSYYQKGLSALTLIESVRQQTAEAYEEAKRYVTESLTIYETTRSLQEKMQKELQTRDITVASRERDIIIRAEHLDTKAEKLRVKELQIIDREKTLEREVNRLKKKYG